MNEENLSVDDDFLNVRFDPKFRQIFKEKIESLQGESIAEEYLLPVEFIGSYPGNIQTYLNTMVSRVMKSAGACGLRLRKSDPKIAFYTASAWFKNNKNTELNLPASNIQWQGSQPIIQVITPVEINSSEVLIKTARLLFSKLFGTLFFKENVLTRKPYLVDSDSAVEPKFDTVEKFHFSRLYDEYPSTVLHRLRDFTLNKKLSKDKRIESGKQEFYRLVSSNMGDANSLYNDLMNTIFLAHLQFAEKDPQAFFHRVSEKIFNALPKLGLVLPHEMRFFQSLKDRNQWQLFDGIADKAQYLKNYVGDLLECSDYLELAKEKEIKDFSASDYWISVLNNRMRFLKRKGLVKLFLIDDSRLTLNQKKDMLEFPLWVWRQQIFKNYPKTLPTSRVLTIITNQYKNSIYQKILEASFRAVSCLKAVQHKAKDGFSASVDFKRFQSLLAGLNIRVPIIEDLLYTCRIAPQMNLSNRTEDKSVVKAAKQFEIGWSYFVSFALIHQFYLGKKAPNSDKASKFLSIVKQHLESKLENRASLQIAYLLLLLYLNTRYDLKKIINSVTNGSETLDFFILHDSKIKNSSAAITSKIKTYSGSIFR